ncbi:MAG: immune inhibitor A domain-containing protein [Singulisphaera sp.]
MSVSDGESAGGDARHRSTTPIRDGSGRRPEAEGWARCGCAPDASRRSFVPRNGYLRTNKQNFLNRQNAERTARPAGAATPLMLRGTRSLPVILLEYKNVPAPFPAGTYKELLFGEGNKKKTMTRYYKDASGARLKVTGQVLGPYKLPKEDTYYENRMNGGGKPFGEMLTFGLRKADEGVDFGQFDNDGPDGRPNSGDDDGVVDTLFFIHPEAGARMWWCQRQQYLVALLALRRSRLRALRPVRDHGHPTQLPR